jgi:isoquinoline 1-oxidoreductase beta subunit
LTAALYGEIILKDGRIEQGNFDTYQALRINEAPIIEMHMIDSQEEPAASVSPAPRRPLRPSLTRSSH